LSKGMNRSFEKPPKPRGDGEIDLKVRYLKGEQRYGF
jgi:hypothetical protein